jgi:hypothetical protein
MFRSGLLCLAATLLTHNLSGATAAALELAPADLAIILKADGETRITFDPILMPPAWQNRIAKAFQPTPVGDAFFAESPEASWRLVAVRLAPCQPLIGYVTPLNDTLCFPQLRLVWQPIDATYVDPKFRYMADDRAIHALYEILPDALLTPAESREWLRTKALGTGMNDEDRARFVHLQQRLLEGLRQSILALRMDRDESLYRDLGLRPEFAQAQSAEAFVGALQAFLHRFATPDQLMELTAFSLPEGRMPPLLDEWAFVAFQPAERGKDLAQANLVIRSARDGRPLFDYGKDMTVGARYETESLIAALPGLPKADQDEIRATVILNFPDRARLEARIADPRQTHVAHTSCASCHKLNKPAFDFHNLSYFRDHDITVSARVRGDVARELQWLRSIP